MTTGFGFSIYELYKSLTKCAQAYRAFASEYGNASPQFAAFRDELDRVDQALRLQEPLNAWTGQEYSGCVVFRGVLDESRHFAEKQRRIVDKGVQSNGHTALAGLLQTALAAFEATLPRLQERVVHNRVALLTFNVTLLLQKSFHQDSHSTLADLQKSMAASGLTHERSTHVEHLLRKLSNIGSTYIRLIENDAQPSHARLPKPDTLDSEFEGCLASVCSLVGLPAHHLAAIAVSSFAPTCSQGWWHIIVESASQISQAPDSLTSEPRTERSCRVKIKIEGVSFIAHSYVLFRRCVFWRNEQGSVIVEHRLAQSTRKCFPYTFPKMMNKPLNLTFLELQDLCIKSSRDRVVACKPRYTFLTQQDYQMFQTDIRARELVNEFHISSIAHKSSRGADAHNECVKVWGPSSGSVDRSISFPAVFGTGAKNYEFPLKWFNSPTSNARSMTARLEITREPGSVAPASVSSIGDKTSSLKSGLRFMRRAATSSSTSTSVAAEVPSNASIRSVNTFAANSAYAPREVVDRLGYIEFKFSSTAELDSFVAAASEPFVAATPATWNSAPSLYAASSPSLSSTTWASSPISFQQPTSEKAPAYGASPMSPTGLLQLPDAAMDKPTPVLDQPADMFDLPHASLNGLVIRSDDDMDLSVPLQALTPSSLLREGR